MRSVIHIRAWPGMARYRKPSRPVRRWRPLLWPCTVAYVSADRDATTEVWGVGATIACHPATGYIAAVVIVPDESLPEFRGWGRICSVTGQPWQVVTLSEYWAYDAKREDRWWAFSPAAYRSHAPWATWGLGRFLALGAEHIAPRSATRQDPGISRADQWLLWPRSWAKPNTNGHMCGVSPHRPSITLRTRRVGWTARFDPPKYGFDQATFDHYGQFDRESHSYYAGTMVDLEALRYALGSSAEVPEMPYSVSVTPEGADTVAEATEALWGLWEALDEEAYGWFSSARDREEGTRRLEVSTTLSPGSLASQLLTRCNLTPPLVQLNLSPEVLRAWSSSFYGGLCAADPDYLGTPTPVVAADISSCYPLVAHRLGWWQTICAESVAQVDVLPELLTVLADAIDDPTTLLDPQVWERMGLTLCKVVPDDDVLPVAIPDASRDDDRTERVPVTSAAPLWYSWADIAASVVLTGRIPHIVAATRLVPTGTQKPKRRVPVLPDLTLDTTKDPLLTLRGRVAKPLLNALVFGNFCRFDRERTRKNKKWVLTDKPGPWNFMPLASSVTAGARLLLALAERFAKDAGGKVIYCDTDSAFLADVGEECLAPFERFAISEKWLVWKAEQVTTTIYGPKRHYESRDGVVVAHTEPGLGGVYLAPPERPEMIGRHRAWTLDLCQADLEGSPLPSWVSFPALRRLPVPTAAVLASLPPQLGLCPGSYYVAATSLWGTTIYARYKDDLTNWRQWTWYTSDGGHVYPATVSEDQDPDLTLVQSLAMRWSMWRRPSRAQRIHSVEVTGTRFVGSVSGVIDARSIGAAPRGQRPVGAMSCALPECDTPVPRKGALYCCTTHKERATKRRARAMH